MVNLFGYIAAGLTILFAGAKVFGHIDWSWFIVFSPAIAFGATVFVLQILLVALLVVLTNRQARALDWGKLGL